MYVHCYTLCLWLLVAQSHKIYPDRVLILDIDGTLYDDSCGVEAQIREKTSDFAGKLGYKASEADELHRTFGSTFRGLCEAGLSRSLQRDFFNFVYSDLRLTNLREYTEKRTGYSSSLKTAHRVLSKLRVPVVVASNSPSFHVRRVLCKVGLSGMGIHAMLTPDNLGGLTKTEDSFWRPLFQLCSTSSHASAMLIDDNALNVLKARSLGLRALHISPDFSLLEALAYFLDILRTDELEIMETKDASWLNMGAFKFESSKYLEAKGSIDGIALNKDCRAVLSESLVDRLQGARIKDDSLVLRVLDLGAGLMTMLDLTLEEAVTVAKAVGVKDINVKYVAFENNPTLQSHITNKLNSLGLKMESASDDDVFRRFEGSVDRSSVSVQVEANVLAVDFMSPDAANAVREFLGHGGPDLVTGCAVADLVPPDELASQLLSLGGDDAGAILYMPITFSGNTRLKFAGTWLNSQTRKLDDAVFSSYHRYLRSQGQHIDAALLCKTLSNFGFCVYKQRGTEQGNGVDRLREKDESTTDNLPRSEWRVCQSLHPYMWRSMLRFLALGVMSDTVTCEQSGTSTALTIDDLQAWFSELQRIEPDQSRDSAEPELLVSNVDILARFPAIPRRCNEEEEGESGPTWADEITKHFPVKVDNLKYSPQQTSFAAVSSHAKSHATFSVPSLAPTTSPCANPDLPSPLSQYRHMVEFVAPRNVRVVIEPLPFPACGQLLLRTICSMVSTGTELKVFAGDMDSSLEADVSFASMAGERLAYPLRYGYSLVGEVVSVGPDLRNREQELVGKRVFSFSTHGTAALADLASVMFIPDDVSFEDAVFFPAMETAVSLAMKLHPMLGERVGVVGQGLIGLLAAAMLATLGCELWLLEIDDRRLALAERFLELITVESSRSSSSVRFYNPQSKRLRTSASSYSAPYVTTESFSIPELDACLEVSGSMAGLQTAIDSTGESGRVVLGSWYGEGNSTSKQGLKLGMKFHRSHLHISASQVSKIPCELSGRWSKQRRNELTWQLLSKIRPARMLEGIAPVSISEEGSAGVQRVYERLRTGESVTAMFVN